MKLEGARILITGGSSGIGYALAEQCTARGARVAINGRNRQRLEEAAARLSAVPIAGDVGIEEEARRIVKTATAELGGLDVLVNNAAWGARMPVEEIDAKSFLAMWQSNVLGAALMARECIPYLKEGGGSIVNIASTAARKGYARGSAYVATKFALRGMSQCWQAELRPHDIRVILILPSEVQTPFATGRPPTIQPHKLIAEDIAHAVVGALEMHDRGFIPELTVFATNPWRE